MITCPFKRVTLSEVVLLVGVLPDEAVLRVVQGVELVEEEALAPRGFLDVVELKFEHCLAHTLSEDVP